MRRPDFICLGTQKAGTTSLHDILTQHPDIFLPEAKEAHFFDKNDRFIKGVDWWLAEFFSAYSGEQTIGVFTPDYIYLRQATERLKEEYGANLKMIVILRHPIDRAYSQYLMSLRRGFEELPFVDAINEEETRISKGEFELNNFSYIDRGRYLEQLKRYSFVPEQNKLYLSFEKDIKVNLKETITKIQDFLGVPQHELDLSKKSNQASSSRSKKVQQIVRNDNPIKKVLKTLLGKKMSRKLRTKAIQLNESKLLTQKSLTPQLRKDLFNKYYAQEVAELSSITKIDFSYWND